MKYLCLGALSGVLFVTSLSWADGDAPTRSMNSSEAATFKQVQSTIKSSLPPAADGVAVSYSGFDRKDIAETASPARMSPLLFNAQYTLTGEKRESSMQSMQMDLIKGNSDQQGKRAALEARTEELKQARKRAKSPEEKERIRAELKKINDEENALVDQIAAGATSGWNQAAKVADKSLPPKEMTVRVLVNQEVHVSDSAKPYQVNGAAQAFEQNDKCQEGSYCITMLVGSFEPEKRISGSTRYNLRDSGGTAPTNARGLAVIVGGPKDKKGFVQQFVKQINTAKLQGLVK